MLGRTRLGSVAKVIAGQSPDGRYYNTDENGLPFYQGKKEFTDRYLGPPTIWTTEITKEAAAGDILMSVRAPVGPINFATERICIGRGLAAIRCTEKLDQDFLFYQLLHKQPEIAGTEGAVFPSISKMGIEGIQVWVPALLEQRRIVAILDEAFDAIATAKANTNKVFEGTRELFESALRDLFGSQTTVWTHKTLREVSKDFGRGKSKHRPRNDPSLYGGPYPFIQTGDVRNSEHLITEYAQTYSEAGLAQSKLWPRGTLCITIAANIAETGILNFDACFPDSVIGVVVDEAKTTSKYLEYMLHTVRRRLKAKGKGSAQDNINLGTFENERFPFPDLATQERIVSKLDDLTSRIQGIQITLSRKLAALDELKKSLLHQAFTGQLTAKAADRQLEAVA